MGLTAPVKYVSDAARMQDVFAKTVTAANNAVQRRFRYRAFIETWLSQSRPKIPFSTLPGPTAPGNKKAITIFGAWFLESKGPEAKTGPLPSGFADGNNVNDWLWQLYDPTNGTVSAGDVLRGQTGDINARGYNTTVSYP